MSTFLQVCTMLGSLGMFLYGMSLMSGGLQKMAGDKLRSFMAAMTSTAFKRVLTGIVVTALVQSSTATTLMLVSFVNAGLLSLANAIGVIMGANIGTTVTAWIFALSFGGGSFSLGAIAVPLMFLGYLLIASKKKNNKNFGEFVMGFAFLFLGLSTLRETSTMLLDNDPVRIFLSHLTGFGIGSILIFMVTGAIMTLMLQSSAATMAITMVLVANGYIPFEMAAAMVLGENIGTTITSNIAASVANVSAKRTARAHMLFNVFGVCWVFCLFHPFLKLVGSIVELFGFPNPATTDFGAADETTRHALVASLPYSVATLHSLFNIINTMILIWFVPVIEKIVTWMVPSPKGEEEVFRLKYISRGPLNTAELSLNEAKLEVVHFGEICYKGFAYIRQAVNEPDPEKFEQINDKLVKYEAITDNIEYEIAQYLGEVSKGELSSSSTERIKSIYKIIGEMESLGDSGEAIGRMIRRIHVHGKHFDANMLRKLNRLMDYVEVAYKTMLYEMEDRGMFAASNGGYIYISKLYSTIGINGLNEAARFLGMKVSNNPEYIQFLQLILGTIKEENKRHSIKDKKKPFLFNSEVVPAEGLGGKNYRWDKEDGYWVPEDENLYNSYFYDAHDDTQVLDKFILHGRQTYQYTDGGSALHCNLQDHLSKEQYLKLIDFAIQNGTSYYTFNIPNSKCEDCGHIIKKPIEVCPCCGSTNITQYTRIIGYLRPIPAFGKDRQIEAAKRTYSCNL